MYLKKFKIEVTKSMDMAAVFHSRDRMESFIDYFCYSSAKKFKEHTDKKEGIPPTVFHAKSKSLISDYSWLLHNISDWMAGYGGCDKEEAIEFFKRYFVVGNKGFDFHNKFLINVIFNMVYNLVNIKINYGLRDTIYATPAVFKGYNGEFFQFISVPFKYLNVKNMCSDKTQEMIEETIYSTDFEQVAFGKKAVENFWKDKERKFAYGL